MAAPQFISEVGTFETIDLSPLPNLKCTLCSTNPPTFKFRQGTDGYCCLPCTCRLLAEMAQRGIDQWIGLAKP